MLPDSFNETIHVYIHKQPAIHQNPRTHLDKCSCTTRCMSDQWKSDTEKDCPCWKQHHLFLLYQSVILSITMVWLSQPCHSPYCWSSTQHGAKWSHDNDSGKQKTKENPLRSCDTCYTCYWWKLVQKSVEHAIAYMYQNAKNLLHNFIQEETACRPARDKSWKSQTGQSIPRMWSLTEHMHTFYMRLWKTSASVQAILRPVRLSGYTVSWIASLKNQRKNTKGS